MSSTAASAAAEAPLRIVAGPTGAGKSALALAIAERHGAVIISADSRQGYKGFDLGTAKPTAEERSRVRHEGIDVADPSQRWSAARFASDAVGWITEAEARNQPALVVGGTGLWIRALVRPLADEPPMDPASRRQLEAALATITTGELRRWVETLDPPRAKLGRVQLLRAIEIALLTGTRASDWHAAGEAKPRLAARWVIVDPGEELHVRQAQRFDAMLASGWADEVRALRTAVPTDAPAWNACGYLAVLAWVEGRSSLDEARDAVLASTRQYAKRQRTWFRNQLGEEPAVLRLDPRDGDALERADRWLFDGEHA